MFCIQGPISWKYKKEIPEKSAKIFFTQRFCHFVIKRSPHCDIDFVFIDRKQIIQKFPFPPSEQHTVIVNFGIELQVQVIQTEVLYFGTVILYVKQGLIHL